MRIGRNFKSGYESGYEMTMSKNMTSIGGAYSQSSPINSEQYRKAQKIK